MTILLSRDTITNKYADNLWHFFNNQIHTRHTRYWPKKNDYTLKDGSTITFSHNILAYKSNKNPPEYRYAFVGSELGSGSFAYVNNIDYKMLLTPVSVIFKKSSNVVKIQQHTVSYPVDRIIQEYQLTKLAVHLSMKAPVIIQDKAHPNDSNNCLSCLVMKKLPGEDLINILNDDLIHPLTPTLTLDQRIKLSQLLLHRLKYQVTELGLIHKDIKPENIKVCLSTMEVNIFDFGLSTTINNPDTAAAGTLLFISPEVFFKAEIPTPKADVYAMGKVLGLLWRGLTYIYQIPDTNTLDAMKAIVYPDLSKLFTGIDGLSDDHKNIIELTIKSMLKVDLKDRMSLDEAIANFGKLDQTVANRDNKRSSPAENSFFNQRSKKKIKIEAGGHVADAPIPTLQSIKPKLIGSVSTNSN